MRKLTLLLFCGLAILANSVSLHAQEQQVQTYKLPTFIDCGSAEAIDNIVKKHGEIPFAESNGAIIIPPGNQMIQGKTTMYINPANGAYTMVLTLPLPYAQESDNFFGIEKCIISFGDNFIPFIQSGEKISI